MSHLASTTAKAAPCPRCHRATLVALDEGISARVDATPLRDRADEIAALLENRWTYTLTNWGHLVHREPGRIAANTLRGAIHAEHKCNRPVQLTLDKMIGLK